MGPQGISTIPTITVGGRVFIDLTNLIVLCGYTATNTRVTFRKMGAAAGYQVTALKTLTIYAVRGLVGLALSATGASAYIELAQSDNDVGLDSATAFTNPVYPGGSTSNEVLRTNVGPGAPSNENGTLNFPVAAGKFLSATMPSGDNMTGYAFGYEA